MSDFLDTLFHIFKGAHPDASDEDIKSHIESMKIAPDQMSSAMSSFDGPSSGTVKTSDMLAKQNPATPPAAPVAPVEPQPELTMDKAPDMSLHIPDANDVKSNFDVNVSDNTVTNNGRPDTLGQTPPMDTPPAPEPVKPLTPETAAPAAPVAKAAGKGGKKAVDPDADLKAAMAPAEKSDAEAEMLAREKHKHDLGIIPVVGAGIGDAISNAASAWGAKGTTGTQEKVEEGLNKSIDKDKKDFADHEKKDPNSDVSKHYQKVLGLMLGEHAKSMDVSKMSAEYIAATLPEVEKYMQKELGLKQIQATKEMSNGLALGKTRDQRFRQLGDALDPSKQKQGAFGVSKQVFDRAERLESLASAFPDGNLDSRQIEELAIGLNAMLSGANVGAQAQVKALIPHSALGSAQKTMEWLTNDPRGMKQQEFVNRMLGSISREKSTAEDQMNRTRFSRVAPYQDLEHEDPATFSDVLQSQGVDPEKWKAWKTGGFKQQSAVQGQENKSSTPNDAAVPVVTDAQSYSRLPSGASYKDANGKTYRKK